MTAILSKTIPAFCLVLVPGIAQAHLGHVGELAGHAHWLGYGALAAAAAAAALLPKRGKKAADEPAAEAAGDEEAGEAEAGEEAAQARIGAR